MTKIRYDIHHLINSVINDISWLTGRDMAVSIEACQNGGCLLFGHLLKYMIRKRFKKESELYVVCTKNGPTHIVVGYDERYWDSNGVYDPSLFEHLTKLEKLEEYENRKGKITDFSISNYVPFHGIIGLDEFILKNTIGVNNYEDIKHNGK